MSETFVERRGPARLSDADYRELMANLSGDPGGPAGAPDSVQEKMMAIKELIEIQAEALSLVIQRHTRADEA